MKVVRRKIARKYYYTWQGELVKQEDVYTTEIKIGFWSRIKVAFCSLKYIDWAMALFYFLCTGFFIIVLLSIFGVVL